MNRSLLRSDRGSLTNIELATILRIQGLLFNLLLSKVAVLEASVHDVALGNGHVYLPKLFEDFDAIPKLVLHLQVIDHHRVVSIYVFNSLLKREAS